MTPEQIKALAEEAAQAAFDVAGLGLTPTARDAYEVISGEDEDMIRLDDSEMALFTLHYHEKLNALRILGGAE